MSARRAGRPTGLPPEERQVLAQRAGRPDGARGAQHRRHADRPSAIWSSSHPALPRRAGDPDRRSSRPSPAPPPRLMTKADAAGPPAARPAQDRRHAVFVDPATCCRKRGPRVRRSRSRRHVPSRRPASRDPTRGPPRRRPACAPPGLLSSTKACCCSGWSWCRLVYAVLTQQRHALSRHQRAAGFMFLVLGAYFVWLLVRSGQTVAMKTWRMRLIDRPTEAAFRPALRALRATCWPGWLWFAPALADAAIHRVCTAGPRCVALLAGVAGLTRRAWPGCIPIGSTGTTPFAARRLVNWLPAPRHQEP
jgi:hypothetical protein